MHVSGWGSSTEHEQLRLTINVTQRVSNLEIVLGKSPDEAYPELLVIVL